MPRPTVPGTPCSPDGLVAHDRCPDTFCTAEQHLRGIMLNFEDRLVAQIRLQQDSMVQRIELVIKEQVCGTPVQTVKADAASCASAVGNPSPSQPICRAIAGQAPTLQAHDPMSPRTPQSSAYTVERTSVKRSRTRDVSELCQAIGWIEPADEQLPSKHASTAGFVAMYGFQWRLVNFVHSNAFKIATSCLVIANSIMIGMALDQDITRALNNEDKIAWESTSDFIFTVAFSAELLVRIIAEHSHFFKGPGKWWNYFDVVVVVTGILELVKLLDFQLTYLRVLRVVKVVKVFRIIRVSRLFRELRMMALSIISCLVSVVWALVFLCMVIYVFALVLLEGARDYLRPDDDTEADPEVKAAVNKWFNGIWASIFSLTQAVSGGNSWGDLARPFQKIHWSYAAGFTLFITFVLFGLLNVLVGVFVSNTSAIAELDRDFVVREEMDRRSSTINQIRQLFLQLDKDNTGTLTWTELKDSLDDPVVKGYFDLVEIEVAEAEGLFKLLDMDESGEVGIDEFIVGCMRLKGSARSLDIAMVLYENKRMYRMLNSFMDEVRGDRKVAR